MPLNFYRGNIFLLQANGVLKTCYCLPHTCWFQKAHGIWLVTSCLSSYRLFAFTNLNGSTKYKSNVLIFHFCLNARTSHVKGLSFTNLQIVNTHSLLQRQPSCYTLRKMTAGAGVLYGVLLLQFTLYLELTSNFELYKFWEMLQLFNVNSAGYP